MRENLFCKCSLAEQLNKFHASGVSFYRKYVSDSGAGILVVTFVLVSCETMIVKISLIQNVPDFPRFVSLHYFSIKITDDNLCSKYSIHDILAIISAKGTLRN